MFNNFAPGMTGIRVSGLDAMIALAVRHGFEGIDLPTEEVVAMTDPIQAAEKTCKAGLKWGQFSISMDPFADRENYDKGLARLRQVAPVARQVGCTRCCSYVLPGSNEQTYDERWRFVIERYKPVIDILGAHGLRLGIEFIGPKTLRDRYKHVFMYTLDEALKLTDEVDPAGTTAGITLDTFHWYTSGGTVEDITGKLGGGRVVLVHVNDAPAGRSRDEQIDGQRALPTETGVIDLAGFMRGLRKVGYDGPLMPEPFQPQAGRLAKLPIDEAAAEVMRYMKQLMALGQG